MHINFKFSISFIRR